MIPPGLYTWNEWIAMVVSDPSAPVFINASYGFGSFYDGNFKAFLDLGKNDKLTISGYGGRDFLDIVFNKEASAESGIQTDWGNKTGSARWTRTTAAPTAPASASPSVAT